MWLVPAARAARDWARAHQVITDHLLTVAVGATLLILMRDYAQSLGTWLTNRVSG